MYACLGNKNNEESCSDDNKDIDIYKHIRCPECGGVGDGNCTCYDASDHFCCELCTEEIDIYEDEHECVIKICDECGENIHDSYHIYRCTSDLTIVGSDKDGNKFCVFARYHDKSFDKHDKYISRHESSFTI